MVQLRFCFPCLRPQMRTSFTISLNHWWGLVDQLILLGWVSYFGVRHSRECFSFIKDWVEKKIRRHIAACGFPAILLASPQGLWHPKGHIDRPTFPAPVTSNGLLHRVQPQPFRFRARHLDEP